MPDKKKAQRKAVLFHFGYNIELSPKLKISDLENLRNQIYE